MSELEGPEILQMTGRAGRPQFDSTGVAVILTRSDKRAKYENIISGRHPLESRLHLQLGEHLNAEIGLGTVFSIESAKNWLRSTFLHVRCRANPLHYGVSLQAGGVDHMIDAKCHQSIEMLRNQGLIELVNERLRTTPYGEFAARYYVRLQTMRHILDLREQATLKDVVCKTIEPVNAEA
jgi:ATP-dependent DNA helicase HFM1/MER3